MSTSKSPSSSTATATLSTTAYAEIKVEKAKGHFERAPTVIGTSATAAEAKRLQEDREGTKSWKHWGPYLSERQWATVREDYSPDGSW